MQNFPVILFSVGCISLIATLVTGWIIIPLYIHNSIENEMSLYNGTKVAGEWRNPDQEVYMSVYIFNVTNPEEIESGGEPLINELGPYVYRQRIVKRITEENIENDTIRYFESRTYHFVDELSNGSEDDVIFALNVPYVAVAQELSTYSSMIRWLAATYIMKFKATVFIKLSVKAFLFEGTYQPMVHEIEEITGQHYLPNSTFGIFYGKNGTENGEMEIYSGFQDSFRIGEIISWKGKTELDYWPASYYCNMLNGSDGAAFHPFVTKKSTLYIFHPDLCRSVYLTYKNDAEVLGIPGYLFTPPPQMSSADNPDNRCFCVDKNKDKCPKDGAYQLKSCQHGVPLLLSFPHFFNGDSEYIRKFQLAPDSELHETQIYLEPTTGTPLKLRKRIQLNADVRKLPNDNSFRRIQDMVFPLLWMEESYLMRDENVELFRLNLITPLKIVQWTKWFAFGCSLTLIFISTFIFLIRVRRKPVFV